MTQTTIADLEKRLQVLEDRLAIFQLVATYGPAVDSLSESDVAEIWTEDGVYDAGGGAPYVGRPQIGKLIESDLHQKFVVAGCAHVGSLPYLTIDGDTAVATNYTRVYMREGDHWTVARASANRWELIRTADGSWRVKHRLNRPIDGSVQPRQILGSALR